MKPLKVSALHEMANDMEEVLGLERSPVGVKVEAGVREPEK